MSDIREYAEGMEVEIITEAPNKYNGLTEPRLVISARNEGGYNGTLVDLLDIVSWVKSNMPELI